MVKSILIPLDPSPYTDSAIEIGCRMAKYHGAQLTGLVILDIPGIEKQIGPVPIGASYYADKYHGRKTANGEVFNMYDLTAAHKTLPFNTLLEVENLSNK